MSGIRNNLMSPPWRIDPMTHTPWSYKVVSKHSETRPTYKNVFTWFKFGHNQNSPLVQQYSAPIATAGMCSEVLQACQALDLLHCVKTLQLQLIFRRRKKSQGAKSGEWGGCNRVAMLLWLRNSHVRAWWEGCQVVFNCPGATI